MKNKEKSILIHVSMQKGELLRWQEGIQISGDSRHYIRRLIRIFESKEASGSKPHFKLSVAGYTSISFVNRIWKEDHEALKRYAKKYGFTPGLFLIALTTVEWASVGAHFCFGVLKQLI
ncbi:hypothetical protein CH373_04695 [Leptospira perolatii]|uniref:Uncharacterized protein n=1 Tax=Leptospira perolatii TaxID=2023191 RepID=A0A2M9ZQ86_9LEPT|nr:hypothetical protein [Leptospira perolatii]PJZ68319.1 hypothetical protein CH360_16900 [Leptospira perolatii]PJZ74214.1 hypothetical protein CH373_04695 [Leptospira perolatii]